MLEVGLRSFLYGCIGYQVVLRKTILPLSFYHQSYRLICSPFTVPQLSMHSCREVIGIADLSYGVDLFTAFYNHFRSIDDNLSKDII